MSINPISSAAGDASGIRLQRILEMSSEQTLDLAEKLIKINVQQTISEGQSESMGQVINTLV